MKLSNDDINVLKNVLMYNNGIHFTPGNSIVSMSIDDSVIIKYSSPTLDIESSFAVYDLSTLLRNIQNLREPFSITLKNNVATLKDDYISIKYLSCHPDMIKKPEKTNMKAATPLCELDFMKADIEYINKLSSLNGFTDIKFIRDSNKVSYILFDSNNPDGNDAIRELGEYAGEDFNITFELKNFGILSGDYTLEIYPRQIKFTNKNIDLIYHIVAKMKAI